MALRLSSSGQSAKDFFISRDWRRPFNWTQPIPSTQPGRRAKGDGSTLVPLLERLDDSAYHVTLPANAGGIVNYYWEVGDAFRNFPSQEYLPYAMPWRVWITFEPASISGTAPAGECCQGLGYGSNIVVNPPYVGVASIAPFYQLRYNFARVKWEVLCSPGNTVPAFVVDCTIQPSFINDIGNTGIVNFVEASLEFVPGPGGSNNHVRAYADGVLIADVVDSRNNGLNFQNTYPFLTYFVSSGSGASTKINEAGFYFPRIYQPIPRTS